MECEECHGLVVLSDDGRDELGCRDCGLVVSTGIEAPVLSTDERGPGLSSPNPTTMTTTPPPWNVGRDAAGRPLSSVVSSRMQRLTTVDSRVVSKQDRSSRRLHEAVHGLALRSDDLVDVEDRAFYVARKAARARVFVGWDFRLVAAGAFRFALMERDGYVRDERIVALVSPSDSKTTEEELLTAYKRIVRVVGVTPPRAPATKIAADLVEELGLPSDLNVLVRAILETMELSTRPRIDAGSAVYEACQVSGIRMSQNRVAEASGTTDVSLRSRLRL